MADAPATPAPRPEYLLTGGAGVACLRHDPPGPPRGGVVVVPPFGWEEMASYRERYAWGQRLAAAGYAVLRLDLPGMGDSAGGPRDEDRLAAWLLAIRDAADHLRAGAGSPRVALAGIGFGGLLAVLALGGGARAEELVLWDAPATGRGAVRKLKAFARLQEPDEAQDALPEGWLEVGGLVLSAELLAALQAADARTVPLDGVRRALVLEVRGGQGDAALAERLEQAGVTVERAPGAGYAEMMDHPQFFAEPEATFARVQAWLDAAPAGEGAAPAPAAAAPAVSAALELAGGVREEPVVLERPAGAMLGVLALPAQDAGHDVAAVLLNAGALRRTGPNRMWVEAARRWAARGVPTLRVDLPGIGDSAGDAAVIRENLAFHREEMTSAVTAALDELERRGHGRRFVVAGLCSGAYSAFQAAVADERVVGIGMLNPRLLRWDEGTAKELRRRRMAERLTLGRARDLLAGRVSRQAVRRAVREAGVLLRDRLRPRAAGDAVAVPRAEALPLEDALDLLRDRGTAVVLGFSGGEPVRDELDEPALRDRLPSWPNLRLVDLPGSNHELRSLTAQRRGHAELDALLDGALAQPSR